MASVLAFDTRPKELSETEALDWLRQQPHGHAPANSAVLAERWGWSRQRVARCLRTWQAAGLVTRVGKNLAVSVRDEDEAARAEPAAAPAQMVPPAAPQPVIPTVEPPAPATPIALPPLSIIAAPVMPPGSPVGSRLIAVIVGVTALALAAVGLVLNAHFAASLGQTGLAAVLLASIGLAMDV